MATSCCGSPRPCSTGSEPACARHAAFLAAADGSAPPDAIHDIGATAVAEWRRGWMPGAGAALDCDEADPVFPLRIPLAIEGIDMVGWVLLGPRPDGSFYGKDERAVLAAIADPVTRRLSHRPPARRA